MVHSAPPSQHQDDWLSRIYQWIAYANSVVEEFGRLSPAAAA